MIGITFDTGALISLIDQRHLSMRKVFDAAQAIGVPMHVPSVVVVEWWRTGKREKRRAEYLRAMHIIDLNGQLAKLAGAVLSVVSAGTVDAVVMATAAYCGDFTVYTSDPSDLTALRDSVPALSKITVNTV